MATQREHAADAARYATHPAERLSTQFDHNAMEQERRARDQLGSTELALRRWLVGHPLASVESTAEGMLLHRMDGTSLVIRSAVLGTLLKNAGDVFGLVPAHVTLTVVTEGSGAAVDMVIEGAGGAWAVQLHCAWPLVMYEEGMQPDLSDEMRARVERRRLDQEMAVVQRAHEDPLSTEHIRQTVDYLRKVQSPWRG